MIVSARRRMAARRPGFTLLEVLVVVAILVILAGVAGVYVFGFLDEAKADTARSQCAALENAARSFYVKNSRMPNQLMDLVAPDQSVFPGAKPILDGGQQAILDPWGNPYQSDFSQFDQYNSPDPQVWTYENGNQNMPIYSARRVKKGQPMQ